VLFKSPLARNVCESIQVFDDGGWSLSSRLILACVALSRFRNDEPLQKRAYQHRRICRLQPMLGEPMAVLSPQLESANAGPVTGEDCPSWLSFKLGKRLSASLSPED